jgi:hypothetical protein
MRQSRSGGSVPVLVRDLRERCLEFHLRPDRYLLQSCDLFKSQMWHCTTSYQIGHFGHMNTTDLASAVNEISEACTRSGLHVSFFWSALEFLPRRSRLRPK